MSVRFVDLGASSFASVDELMRRLQRLRIEDRIADTVLLVSHPEVLTLGPRAVKDGATPPDGFDAIATDRGGGLTWHGPGQLVVYPIIHWSMASERSVNAIVNRLEGWIIDAFQVLGIEAQRDPRMRGVWVGEWKIVSIGLSFLHWVSRHGVSINIDPDLSRLEQVAGCGLDPGMTSSLEALGFPCTRDEVVAALLATFPASLERPAEGHSVNTPPPWRDLSAPPWDAHPVRTDP